MRTSPRSARKAPTRETPRRWPGFAIDALAGLFALASGTVCAALVARTLAGDEVADYQFIAWLLPCVAVVSTWGLPNACLWLIPECDTSDPASARAVYSRVSRLAGLCGAGVALIAGLVTWLAVPHDRQTAYAMVALAAVPLAWGGVLAGALLALDEYRTLLRLNGVGGLLDMAGVAAAVAWAPSLEWIVGALAAAVWVRFLLQAFFVTRAWRGRDGGGAGPAPWGSPEMRRVYVFCRDLALLLVIDVVVWQRSEMLFLNAWSLRHEVARYGMAYELASIPWRVAALFGGVLPSLMVLLHDLPEGVDMGPVYRKMTRYLGMAILPVCLAVFVWRKPLCAALFGAGYEDVAELVAWLIVPAGLSAVFVVGSAAQAGGGRRAILLRWGALTALLDIVLAVLLIPGSARGETISGAQAAAFSCALAQLVAGAVALRYRSLDLDLRADLDGLTRAAVASGTAVALAWCATRFAPAWAAAAVGLVAYAGAVVAFGCIPEEDRERLPGPLRRSLVPDRISLRRRTTEESPPDA